MFKLLIADDEQLEREALRYIISKSIDSIVVIEEAVNGREAISKVQSFQPDIVILDINMPGINGIEAGWKIREKNSDIIIIFLTAFHQFDYAHEAIKIGVDDYLIKPSSENRIIEVITKATIKLESLKSLKRERENIELKLDKATDYLSSEFTQNLATRIMDTDKFINYLTLLDMNFLIGRGVILKLNYDSYPISVDSDYQKKILKKRCLRILYNHLNRFELNYSLNMDFTNINILIYSDKMNHHLDDKILELLNRVSAEIKEDINILTIFGFGSLFTESKGSIQSFTEAKKMISGNLDRSNPEDINQQIPLELEINMEQAIISADSEQVESLFLELERWIFLSNNSFEFKIRCCKDFSAILRHCAVMQFPVGFCHINTNDIDTSNNEQELIHSFKYFLNELLDTIINLYNLENTPAIKRACKYINQNFKNSDISLEKTANHCNLSTFYLSKIFKADKKLNFINYLTELRICEAKKLLRDSNLSIKEIAESIGYNDPNYLTRVFKKLEKVSPSDYRNKKMLKTQ